MYRVVFISVQKNEENFKSGMSKVGVPHEAVETMINKAPIIMKADLTLEAARRYADVINDMGGKVNIQDDGVVETSKRIGATFEIKPLESFTMCAQCGHKQLKADTCVKCGYLLKRA